MGDFVVIWFLAHIPEGATGGVARSVHTLEQGMCDRGHATHIVYAHSHEQYLVYALRCAVLFLLGFPRPHWICARSTDGIFCTLLIRLLHLKTRVALYSHGWEENVYKTERQQPKIWGATTGIFGRLIRFPLLRFTARNAHRIFTGTVSEALYLKQQFPHTLVAVTPNGVASSLAPHWVTRTNTPEKQLPNCIGWIGVDTWKKDLPYALAVIAELKKLNPAVRLIIVGMSAIEVTARCPKLAATSQVDARGTIPADGMTQIYQECPYFLSTSRYEGGRAYALLEAMAQGCIVFATALPSTLEFVQHDKNGYILSGNSVSADADLIADKIKQNDPAIRQAALVCSQRHSIDRQISRFERALL